MIDNTVENQHSEEHLNEQLNALVRLYNDGCDHKRWFLRFNQLASANSYDEIKQLLLADKALQERFFSVLSTIAQDCFDQKQWACCIKICELELKLGEEYIRQDTAVMERGEARYTHLLHQLALACFHEKKYDKSINTFWAILSLPDGYIKNKFTLYPEISECMICEHFGEAFHQNSQYVMVKELIESELHRYQLEHKKLTSKDKAVVMDVANTHADIFMRLNEDRVDEVVQEYSSLIEHHGPELKQLKDVKKTIQIDLSKLNEDEIKILEMIARKHNESLYADYMPVAAEVALEVVGEVDPFH